MILAYVVISIVVSMKMFVDTSDIEKIIKKINKYLLIKLLFNFVIANISILFIVVFWGEMKVLKIFPPVISFVLSSIDSLCFYRVVKKVRNLKCNKKQYYFQVIGDNVILHITWFAICFLHMFDFVNTNDCIYIFSYILFCVLMNMLIVYIRKHIMCCKVVSNEKLLNVINKHKITKYKIFEYDGKTRKTANAMVDSVFDRGNIYFSDYLLENMSEEEIEAIYLHEIGHIKKKHISLRNFLLIMIMPIMYCIGAIMDTIEKHVHINIMLGIMVGMSIMIGYMVFFYLYVSRIQEYAADEYAAYNISDIEVLCRALENLQKLNDSFESEKGTEILKTHPNVNKRLIRIRKLHCKGEI